jgi:hypothetical protein
MMVSDALGYIVTRLGGGNLWLLKLAPSCIVPLQIKFLELSGTEKKKLSLFMQCPWISSLLRLLQPQGLHTANVVTGPGLVLIFYIFSFTTKFFSLNQ